METRQICEIQKKAFETFLTQKIYIYSDTLEPLPVKYTMIGTNVIKCDIKFHRVNFNDTKSIALMRKKHSA